MTWTGKYDAAVECLTLLGFMILAGLLVLLLCGCQVAGAETKHVQTAQVNDYTGQGSTRFVYMSKPPQDRQPTLAELLAGCPSDLPADLPAESDCTQPTARPAPSKQLYYVYPDKDGNWIAVPIKRRNP